MSIVSLREDKRKRWDYKYMVMKELNCQRTLNSVNTSPNENTSRYILELQNDTDWCVGWIGMRPLQAFGFRFLWLNDKGVWMRLKGTKLNLAPERALLEALYIVTSISGPLFNAFHTSFLPSAILPLFFPNVENEESRPGVSEEDITGNDSLSIAWVRASHQTSFTLIFSFYFFLFLLFRYNESRKRNSSRTYDH